MSLAFIYPVYFGTADKDYDELERTFFLSNTTKVFTEQLKFREKAIAEYKSNLASFYGDERLDSAFNNPIRNKIGIRYLLPQSSTAFSISLDNYTLAPAILIGYDSLKVIYSIDENKINSIIKNQNIQLNEFENVLKYQDYLKITYKSSFHLRTVGVVICVGAFIFLYYLIAFVKTVDEDIAGETMKNRISITFGILKRKKAENVTVDDLKNISKEQLNANYNHSLDKITKQLKDIQDGNMEYFIIEEMARKAELKMKEVSTRSNLMLVAGLIMAFIGVTVFYITLPINTSSIADTWKIVTLSIRPTLILIFIEGISWYLLKQHKSLLNDYKYYHSIFNKKNNYLAAFKLISQNKSNDSSLQNILPLTLLSEEIKNIPESKDDETVVETSNNLLMSLIDKLVNKF